VRPSRRRHPVRHTGASLPGVHAPDTAPRHGASGEARAPPVTAAPPRGLVQVVYAAPLFPPVVCSHVPSRPPPLLYLSLTLLLLHDFSLHVRFGGGNLGQRRQMNKARSVLA
jgi:hypothetical protein